MASLLVAIVCASRIRLAFRIWTTSVSKSGKTFRDLKRT